jgi:hypothetical protein
MPMSCILRLLPVCLGCVIVGCTSDPELGRVGGPIEDVRVELPESAPPDSDPPDAGPDAEGGAEAEAGGQVPFCEAFKVMKVCRRCHQTPSPVSAPFPLQRWEDTQDTYLDRLIWERMIGALESDFMPLRGSPIEIIDPPIQPLDPTCKNTLLTWLRQGAQPVGGTSCDPNLSCEGCPNFP